MQQQIRMLAIAVMISLTAGCQNLPGTNRQQGAVAGGVAGAAVGSQVGDSTMATLIGAIAGGVLGSEIGRRMDTRDRQHVGQSLERNEPVSWYNDDTDTSYRVNPTSTYESRGRTCREYTMIAQVEGEPREVEGTACKQPDGSWQVES